MECDVQRAFQDRLHRREQRNASQPQINIAPTPQPRQSRKKQGGIRKFFLAIALYGTAFSLIGASAASLVMPTTSEEIYIAFLQDIRASTTVALAPAE